MNSLRRIYEAEEGRLVEQTYSGVRRIVSWEGDEEPSWAEWGYVLWLEKMLLNEVDKKGKV